MTDFAAYINEVEWNIWDCSQWHIWRREPMDKYGRPFSHENSDIEKPEYYVADIPPSLRFNAVAMQWAEAWGLRWEEVLAMRYDHWYQRVAYYRATHLVRPWFTGSHGEHMAALASTGKITIRQPRR